MHETNANSFRTCGISECICLFMRMLIQKNIATKWFRTEHDLAMGLMGKFYFLTRMIDVKSYLVASRVGGCSLVTPFQWASEREFALSQYIRTNCKVFFKTCMKEVTSFVLKSA